MLAVGPGGQKLIHRTNAGAALPGTLSFRTPADCLRFPVLSADFSALVVSLCHSLFINSEASQEGAQ